MAKFLALLAGIPSAFWQSLINGIKKAMTFMAGAEWMRLITKLAESRKLNEQLQDIIEVERQTAAMSDSAILDELRKDYSPERRKRRRRFMR